MLIDKGHRYDIVNAILDTKETNILSVIEKIKALEEFLEKEDSDENLNYLTRINNFTKDYKESEVSEKLLEKGFESNFYEKIEDIDAEKYLDQKQYLKALEEIISTKEIGNEYLDNTMIMVDDDKVKNNRLALLNKLSLTVSKIFNIKDLVK